MSASAQLRMSQAIATSISMTKSPKPASERQRRHRELVRRNARIVPIEADFVTIRALIIAGRLREDQSGNWSAVRVALNAWIRDLQNYVTRLQRDPFHPTTLQSETTHHSVQTLDREKLARRYEASF